MTGRAHVTGGGHRGRLLISSPTFTGREAQVAAMAATLARAPAIVLVEGEAGIGKSRLVREYLAGPAGARQRAVIAVCPPLRRPCTLGPLVDALRQATANPGTLGLSALAGALRPLFPEWAAELPAAPEPAGDATAARYRLFRALAELLAGLPVDVLVVEDVHWADEATMEFLLFLASQQGPRPSLVVTYRPEDVPAGSLLLRLSSRVGGGSAGIRLSLAALPAADTTRLVSSMLDGSPLSAEFAAFLYRWTDGIPLAAEELVRLMHDRAVLVRRGSEWVCTSLEEISVPGSIRDGVLERIGRLGRDTRGMLGAAAVLAHPAGERALRSVAGLTEARARAALTKLVDSGLLATGRDGLVSFRHALAERAVYEALGAPQRRLLHQRAGRLLEAQSPRPIARLAQHYREAAEPEKWRTCAEQAIDLSLATGDLTTAAALIGDLLAGAGLSGSALIRLIKKMPFAAFPAARFAELVAALRSVLKSGELEQADEADGRLLLGRVLLQMDEYEASRAEVERALPGLGHDPVEAARAMILLGYPTTRTWSASQHRQWLHRAAEVTAPMPRADQINLTVERATALLLLGDQDGWDVAGQIPGEAGLTTREMEYVVKGHLNIGGMAMLWGRHQEARRRLSRALDLARSSKYRAIRDTILASQLHLDWLEGSWDGLAGRAGALAETDLPLVRLDAFLVRGLMHAAGGDGARARQALELVLTSTRELGAVEAMMEPAAALARLALADGRTDEALLITEEPFHILTAKDIWIWAADLGPARAEALALAGRAEEAADLESMFGRGLRGRAAPAAGAALLTCRAIVAEQRGALERAAALFAQAATTWASLPRPYNALLAAEGRARCLVAAGQQAAAVEILTEVLAGLSGLGARGDAVRVIKILNDNGTPVRRPWLGGRRGYGDQISPREMDVVRLLVRGQTNRQIAQALALSPKTVARHIDSAMHKLDVPSRTALAVRAVEDGLVAGGEPAAIAARA